MNDWKIERSNGRCFGLQQLRLLADSIENFISHEKESDLLRPDIYKALKPFWNSNWVSITRVISSSKQVTASTVTAADLETPCVWSCLSDLPKLCQSLAPRAQPLILQSKPLIVFWNSLQKWLPDDRQGLELGLNFELCLLIKVLSALKSQNKLCGVWILFRFFQTVEIEDIAETISTLIPRTVFRIDFCEKQQRKTCLLRFESNR